MLYSNLKVDGITISLLLVAIFPWLGNILKSFEIPNLLKIEYKELERKTEEARKSGLLTVDYEDVNSQKYSFQQIGANDPNLALAGLRIELEKILKEIALAGNIPTERISLRKLIYELRNHEILTNSEIAVLLDIIGLLNNAVHGAKVDKQSYEWALHIGPEILNTLETKIMK